MGAERVNILVVDDDPWVTRLEQLRLEEAGYRAIVTHTAADAVTRAREGDIDLALVDLRLDGSNSGLDLVEQFQAIGLKFPVIIVTAFSEEATVIRALRSGVADYIIKTSSFQENLPEAVERVLRQSRTEMRLAESEARFVSFMDNGPAYCFIKDQAGRFIFVNRQLSELFPESAWVQSTVFEILEPGLAQQVSDDDEEMFRTGQPSQCSYESVAPDGSQNYWVTYRFPMRDIYGRALLGGVCVDVTEQVVTETLLRTSEAKLRAVGDAAIDAIVAADRYANVVSWNPAATRMFGYTAEEMIGQPLEKIVPRRYRRAQRAAIARILAEGIEALHGHSIELVGQRKEGGEFPIELSVGSWREGGALYFTGIVRDVTDRKRAEEELRKREEQLAHSQRLESLGTLAGGVAHEFNNLLQSIQGYTQFARDSLAADDQRRRDLDLVLLAAERASCLTRQLLGFSRRQRLQYEDLNPNQIVQEVAHLVQPLIGEHIELKLELAEDAGSVHADALTLQQLLMNLAINSRDAMPEGGRLLVRTARVALDEQRAREYSNLRSGEYLQLVVSDTGCGMPGEVLEHACEPFFTTKEVGRGTGLGLATVYGIVTQHQGAIRIDSHPNEGTTVEVLLPVVDVVAGLQKPELAKPGPRGCETILIAEDEPLVRELVVRNLEAAGYFVIAVQDGVEAVETYLAGYEAIDLVLLDVVMPRMGGPEVYQRMREANPAVKAIFATAYDSETAGLGALEQSGLRFLQKPAAGPELLEAVREVLDAPAQIAAHI